RAPPPAPPPYAPPPRGRRDRNPARGSTHRARRASRLSRGPRRAVEASGEVFQGSRSQGRRAVREPRGGLETGFPGIPHRSLPPLAADRVIGEMLDVLDESSRVQGFDRGDRAAVERTAAVLGAGR